MRKIVLVDGYNVIRQVPALAEKDERNLESGREALIRFGATWKSFRHDVAELIIVFDGQSDSGFPQSYQQPGGVRVVFTTSGEKADTRIIALAADRGRGVQCTVVSDDNEVRRGCKGEGTLLLGAREFFGQLEANRERRATRPDAPKHALSPREEREITESLAREWGVTD